MRLFLSTLALICLVISASLFATTADAKGAYSDVSDSEPAQLQLPYAADAITTSHVSRTKNGDTVVCPDMIDLLVKYYARDVTCLDANGNSRWVYPAQLVPAGRKFVTVVVTHTYSQVFYTVYWR